MSKAKFVKNEPPKDKVWASPTKKFFVNMLIRDIELMDAIMDLVDNCIDGVHRQLQNDKSIDENKMYEGFHAHITLNGTGFSIVDNCGGIPLTVAKNYAFKLGRDEEYHDDDKLQTVGVYGIGMKRAIFKIGLEAKVISHNHTDIFQVTIPKNWASITDTWYFDFKELSKAPSTLKSTGTHLSISSLHKSISEKFKDKSGFQRDLENKLREHYGYIIQKGFELKLNGITVPELELKLLTTDPEVGSEKSIRPFAYSTTIEGVDIEVIIGFYRPPADLEEIDNEIKGSFARSKSETAGISVTCNDRVVVYANKDYLTGWGDSPVPNYHTQFINIAGVVHFRSTTPFNLPLTTTKRGLDTSSQIYTRTKQIIKKGLKIFTDFTNHWKVPSEERANLFKSAKSINALSPGKTKSADFKLKKAKKDDPGYYQIPDLPRPKQNQDDKYVNISFKKEKSKVEEMLDYYFEGETKSPSQIGNWCFEELYSEID